VLELMKKGSIAYLQSLLALQTGRTNIRLGQKACASTADELSIVMSVCYILYVARTYLTSSSASEKKRQDGDV
jgi:hypothetical protein